MFGGNNEVAGDESVDSMVRELASLATRACLRHGISEPASLVTAERPRYLQQRAPWLFY